MLALAVVVPSASAKPTQPTQTTQRAGATEATLAGGTAVADTDGPDPGLPLSSLTDGLLLPEGKELPPSPGAAKRLDALRRDGEGTRTADAVAGYRLGDAPVLGVPDGWRPYSRTTPGPLGSPPRDSSGVKMALIGGKLYNHPVAQAQDGLLAIESYRVAADKAPYLEQAVADATRLVATRVESRGAWFYPYPFDFKLHSNSRDLIRAPWFSAMAQGQALSLFVRLHEVTGQAKWRTAAEMTLASLSLGPDTAHPSTPWVSWVDGADNLWLEEYAQLPLSRSDRTINGHMFAMFGLWDAWKLLRDPDAYALFRGGAATMANTFGSFRVPGWVSRYCLTHGTLSIGYHNVVIEELLQLHGLTTNPAWSRRADLLATDYPRATAKGTVVMSAGSVTGYRFSSTGTVTGQKTVRLTSSSSAPADARQRILGRAIHYRITAGMLAGYWVSESHPARRLMGVYERTSYPFERLAYFPRGTTTGYKVSDPGGVTSSPVSRRFLRESAAPFDRSAWVSGRHYVHITSGAFADRWVPSSGLRLG